MCYNFFFYVFSSPSSLLFVYHKNAMRQVCFAFTNTIDLDHEWQSLYTVNCVCTIFVRNTVGICHCEPVEDMKIVFARRATAAAAKSSVECMRYPSVRQHTAQIVQQFCRPPRILKVFASSTYIMFGFGYAPQRLVMCIIKCTRAYGPNAYGYSISRECNWPAKATTEMIHDHFPCSTRCYTHHITHIREHQRKSQFGMRSYRIHCIMNGTLAHSHWPQPTK